MEEEMILADIVNSNSWSYLQIAERYKKLAIISEKKCI